MSCCVDVLSGVELKRWLGTEEVDVKLRLWVREASQFSESPFSGIERHIRGVRVKNEGMVKLRFFCT